MDTFNTIVVLLLIVFLMWIFRRRHLYYLSYKLPGPIALPFIGNFIQIGFDKNEGLHRLLKAVQVYHRICRFWIGPFMLIEVRKPEYIKIIAKNYLDKNYFMNSLLDVIDGTLLIAPVPVWKNNRRIMNAMFHKNKLRQYIYAYKTTFERFLSELPEMTGENKFFNIYPYVQKFAAMSGSDVFFKTNNEIGIKKIIKNLGRITYLLYKELLSMPSLLKKINGSSPISEALDSLIRETHGIMHKIVLEKREALKKQHDNNDIDANEQCFLEYLIQNETFTDYQIVRECILMILAATDTVTGTISFVLMVLAIRSEIQEKVMEEIQSIKKPMEELTYEHLNQLVYLERVIKETLRLLPAIPFITRHINEDLTLDDITIPKGTNVIISPFLLHRDPFYWPDPLKFNPDRFLPEEVAKRNPYTFIPFSAGPRNCIGGFYAMNLVKYFLASFVTKYEITTTFETIEDIKLRFSVNLLSRYGHPVQLKPRIL